MRGQLDSMTFQQTHNKVIHTLSQLPRHWVLRMENDERIGLLCYSTFSRPTPSTWPRPVSVQCCLPPGDLQLSTLGKLKSILPDMGHQQPLLWKELPHLLRDPSVGLLGEVRASPGILLAPFSGNPIPFFSFGRTGKVLSVCSYVACLLPSLFTSMETMAIAAFFRPVLYPQIKLALLLSVYLPYLVLFI